MTKDNAMSPKCILEQVIEFERIVRKMKTSLFPEPNCASTDPEAWSGKPSDLGDVEEMYYHEMIADRYGYGYIESMYAILLGHILVTSAGWKWHRDVALGRHVIIRNNREVAMTPQYLRRLFPGTPEEVAEGSDDFDSVVDKAYESLSAAEA
jgi:hypothetical protein